MKHWIWGILTVCLVLGTALPMARAQAYEDLLGEGDRIYAGREDLAKARAAVEVYKKAAGLDPERGEAYWRVSRALYWIGRHTENKARRLAVYKDASDWAGWAVEKAPGQAAAHYWYGVTLGLYGDTKGKLESLKLVDPIKKEMADVIRIDPGFDSGGAYVVLGRLYFKVPGMFGGSNKKSIENLKKALQYGPDRQLTRVYLADVYMDEGRHKEEEKQLQAALQTPCPDLVGPECRMWKARARGLMKTLKEKNK